MGARQASGQEDADCSISAVFSLMNEITMNEDCLAGCNSGSGDCPPAWVPGSADECTAACGRVFEPFWDTCGGVLTDINMGGMDEMGIFCELPAGFLPLPPYSLVPSHPAAHLRSC